MHLIDNTTAASIQPAIPPVGTPGYFRDANPNLGQLATRIDQAWCNAIQNEIANAITGAGLTLNKAVQNQLFTAIQTLIGNATANSISQVIHTVTQNGHGFSENDVVYKNGSVWNLAIASSLAASFSVGLILSVQSTNVFKVMMLGYKPSGFTGLTPGAVLYLSPTLAGKLTATRPNVDGQYIKPVLIVDTSSSGYVINDAPTLFSSGGPDGALLASNNLSDLTDASDARTNLGLGTAAVADSVDFASTEDFNALATDVSDIQSSISTFATITYVDGLISTLSGQITAISADLSDVESAIENIDNDIDSINSSITSINSSLTSKQPLDATLTAFAGLSFSANQFMYSTAADTFSLATITAYGRNLIATADATAARVLLALGSAAQNNTGDFIASSAYGDFAQASDLTALDSRVSDTESDIATLQTDVSGKQPLDGTLTALAALTIAAGKIIYGTAADSFALADSTSYGRGLWNSADAIAARSSLGLVIGTDVQAHDATLDGLAALTIAADKLPYGNGADTFALADLTAFARSILDDSDASTARATLGVTIGTNVQAYNAALASIAGLTTAADKMIYTTASNVYAVADLSSFARTILDDADASAVRTTLGLAIGTNVQAYNAALASIAGLTTAADKMIYTTNSNVYAVADLTAFARTILDDADAAAVKTTLGLLQWNNATSNTVMDPNSGYYITSGGALTFTLPTTAAVGTKVEIAGFGSTSWQILQGSGQSIWWNNQQTTVGVTGSITSGTAKDWIELICVVANTTWVAKGSGFPDVV